jgi:pimeloyl-ACP methyl ester carboxylesterase
LGSIEELADYYPDVKVYICIKFAMVQPAPSGTMFAHCGGPGSLSDCAISSLLGGPEYDTYNRVGIDQRGLGRSLPTFASQVCAEHNYIAHPPSDPKNETQIRLYLRAIKARNQACFYDPQYQLKAKKPVSYDHHGRIASRRLQGSNFTPSFGTAAGTKTHFNFLQYAGTSEVAEDLNRFREAIGAETLSLHGASYGTMIGGVYATMFPEYLDKLILNSPVPPNPNMYQMALDSAQGAQQKYSVYKQSCCHVGMCSINHTTDCCYPGDYMHLCSRRLSDSDESTVNLKGLEDFHVGNKRRLQAPRLWPCAAEDPATYAKPSDNHACGIAGQPNYTDLIGSNAQQIVMSLSTSGSALTEDYFIARYRLAKETYPCVGTAACIQAFVFWWTCSYDWPRETPVASMASSKVKGLIVGFLYDPNTPYIWAQEQHENHPNMHLVTSQVSQHCIQNDGVIDPRSFSNSVCYGFVEDYVKTGKLPVDGTVCPSPLSVPEWTRR